MFREASFIQNLPELASIHSIKSFFQINKTNMYFHVKLSSPSCNVFWLRLKQAQDNCNFTDCLALWWLEA